MNKQDNLAANKESLRYKVSEDEFMIFLVPYSKKILQLIIDNKASNIKKLGYHESILDEVYSEIEGKLSNEKLNAIKYHLNHKFIKELNYQ